MKSDKFCCKEFSLKKINLAPENYLEFYQTQWQSKDEISVIYVIYRIILAVIFTVILIISVIDLNDLDKSAILRAKWLIYLTNWHFSVATIQSILSAYLVTTMYIWIHRNGVLMQTSGVNKILCSVYWALYTIAVNGALFIMFVYWAVVYDEKKDPLSVVNIFTHAINAVILLVDLFIIAHSMRIMHFYFPIAFNMVYIMFSVIYFSLGGTDKNGLPYIYGILNWNKPILTIRNILCICIFAILLHILVCLYVNLRKRISKSFSRNQNLDVLFPLNIIEPSKEDPLEKIAKNEQV